MFIIREALKISQLLDRNTDERHFYIGNVYKSGTYKDGCVYRMISLTAEPI